MAENKQGKIAHKITVINDKVFDSKTESEYYKYLLEESHKGNIKKFERQIHFLLQEAFIIIEGQVIVKSDPSFNSLKKKHKAETIKAMEYICDYVVYNMDDSIDVIDIKGIMTADFAIKKKLFQYRYPQYNFKVIAHYNNNWVDFYENEARKRKNKREKAKAKKEDELLGIKPKKRKSSLKRKVK